MGLLETLADPIGSVVSSLFGGIASGIGASKQASAQREANRTNLQIAREQNAINQSMLNQQQNFAVRTWEMQNEYNDPKSVAYRLQQAGINPAAVFGTGTTQSAGGISNPSGSPAAGATMVAPDVGQIYNSLGASAHNAVNALFQAQLMNEQVKHARSQNYHQDLLNKLDESAFESDLEQRINNSKLTRTQRLQAQQDLDLFRQVKNYRVLAEKNTVALGDKQVQELEAKVVGQRLANDILSINKEWQDRMNRASYQSLLAGISQAYSAARVNDAQAVLYAAQEALTDMQKEGVRLDNKQKDELRDAIVDKAWSEADEAYYTSGIAGKKYYGGIVGQGSTNGAYNFVFGDSSEPNIRRPRYNRNSRSTKKTSGIR